MFGKDRCSCYTGKLTSISSIGTSFKVRFIQVSNAIGSHYLNLGVAYFSVHSTFQYTISTVVPPEFGYPFVCPLVYMF